MSYAHLALAALSAVPSPPCPGGWQEEPFDHVCWNAQNPPGVVALPQGAACPAGKVARADKDLFSGASKLACYTFKSDPSGFSFEDNVAPVCTAPGQAWNEATQTCVAPPAKATVNPWFVGGVVVGLVAVAIWEMSK